jgi:hypothetical protein
VSLRLDSRIDQYLQFSWVIDRSLESYFASVIVGRTATRNGKSICNLTPKAIVDRSYSNDPDIKSEVKPGVNGGRRLKGESFESRKAAHGAALRLISDRWRPGAVKPPGRAIWARSLLGLGMSLMAVALIIAGNSTAKIVGCVLLVVAVGVSRHCAKYLNDAAKLMHSPGAVPSS